MRSFLSGVRSLYSIRFVVSLILFACAFGYAVLVFSLWPGEKPVRQGGDSGPSITTRSDAASSPVEAPRPTAGPNAAFDFYLLVLSWSPTHCASERGRGADDDLQCRSGRPFGFVLHGLWPQNERGYPKNCASGEPREVDADVMDRVLAISPSEQLVQHEWEKHGTCSGLSQQEYFAAAERAFASITIPSDYDRVKRRITTTPDDVRDAVLHANPSLASDSLSATCSRNDFAELWICLDRKLAPRACSEEVRKRHCGGREVRMRAVRGDWPR